MFTDLSPETAASPDLLTESDLADIAERVSFGWDPEIDGPLPDVD